MSIEELKTKIFGLVGTAKVAEQLLLLCKSEIAKAYRKGKKDAEEYHKIDMDHCFYCGMRASELTIMRVATKPPNTPHRWKVIGVACNTCDDKFTSQIEPARNLYKLKDDSFKAE